MVGQKEEDQLPQFDLRKAIFQSSFGFPSGLGSLIEVQCHTHSFKRSPINKKQTTKQATTTNNQKQPTTTKSSPSTQFQNWQVMTQQKDHCIHWHTSEPVFLEISKLFASRSAFAEVVQRLRFADQLGIHAKLFLGKAKNCGELGKLRRLSLEV